MAIKSEIEHHDWYSGGSLRTPSKDNPEYWEGFARCEAGIAILDVYLWQPDFDRPPLQVLHASTIKNGITVQLRQERTPRNYVTKDGALRIVNRWLRNNCVSV